MGRRDTDRETSKVRERDTNREKQGQRNIQIRRTRTGGSYTRAEGQLRETFS